MPQWQAAAVASYFANGKGLPSPSVGYNKTGRAYPDIAAQASDFTVVANRIPEPGVVRQLRHHFGPFIIIIILRFLYLHPTPHAPCAPLYLVPMLIGC